MSNGKGCEEIKTFFTADFEYDAVQVWGRLHAAQNAEELASLSQEMRLTISDAERIKKYSTWNDAGDDVVRLVALRHSENSQALLLARKNFAEAWRQVEKEFYCRVQDLTGYEWHFREFEVILSPFHFGLSNRDGNFVVRSMYQDHLSHCRITAHEILMIQLWRVFESFFDEAVVKDRENFFWGLNEVTTVAILGLDQELNALWHPEQRGVENFLLGYQELNDMKAFLYKLYLSSVDFKSYLEGVRKAYFPN